MRNAEKAILFLFLSIVSLAVVQAFGMLFGVELDEAYPAFKFVFLSVPIILVILHSFVTLGPGKAIFFLLLSASIGFTSEYLGLKYGQFFGTFYTYNPKIATLSTVPIQVIFYWAAFIYTGYCVTNSYLTWLKVNRKKIIIVVLSVILDALFVLAIDLFMDPLEVRQGAWTWVEGGPYFGVPVGNFIGWFTVAALSSGIFRTLEYALRTKVGRVSDLTILIPVILYGIVAVSFVSMAVRFRMFELLALGSLLMFPTVIVNLLLFRKYHNH